MIRISVPSCPLFCEAPSTETIPSGYSHPPVMVSGRLTTLFAAEGASYSNDVYQLAWDGLPDAYNDRVRQRMFRGHLSEFQFEGERVKAAPGWASGECKPRPKGTDREVLSIVPEPAPVRLEILPHQRALVPEPVLHQQLDRVRTVVPGRRAVSHRPHPRHFVERRQSPQQHLLFPLSRL